MLRNVRPSQLWLREEDSAFMSRLLQPTLRLSPRLEVAWSRWLDPTSRCRELILQRRPRKPRLLSVELSRAARHTLWPTLMFITKSFGSIFIEELQENKTEGVLEPPLVSAG
jgi:hypothetical protein